MLAFDVTAADIGADVLDTSVAPAREVNPAARSSVEVISTLIFGTSSVPLEPRSSCQQNRCMQPDVEFC